MHRRLAHGSLLAMALPLVACASASDGAGGDYPGTTSRVETIITGDGESIDIERVYARRSGSAHVLPFDPSEVWRVLPAAFGELGIPLGTYDDRQRLAGNASYRASRRLADERLSTFVDCGRSGGLAAPAADVAPVQMSILTRVVALDAEARVETERASRSVSTELATEGGKRAAMTEADRRNCA
jgi:hypothetical protein